MSVRGSGAKKLMPGHKQQFWLSLTQRRMVGGWLLTLLLALSNLGCTLINQSLEIPKKGIQLIMPGTAPVSGADPVELQEDLFRYSDNLTSTFVGMSSKLEREGQAIPRKELLSIWVALGSEILSTATGANSPGNLVDMVVLTSATRIRLEDEWLPKVYGESARPLLVALRARENDIWLLTEKMLTPPQRQELKDAIDQWRREAKQEATPHASFVRIELTSKIVELASKITGSGRKEAKSQPSSVFGLLDLDPLAGLDPATRELAQTRMLAERAIFVGQRMPQIVQWQAELLAIRMAEMPQIEQVVANSSQFATSGDRLSKVAEAVPALVSSERKAFFQALTVEQAQFFKSLRLERKQLLADLNAGTPGLSNLTREVGLTLAQGERMAAAADTALRTFDGVMARFDRETPKEATKSDQPPFRIKDYAETAGEIALMSGQLTQLHNALKTSLNPEFMDLLSGTADSVAAKTQARGELLVDYVFYRILLLMAAGFLMALIYRYFCARVARPKPR